MYSITNINGIIFIFSPFKDLETASLGIFLKIGSRFEKKEVRGISHFLEHMLFKGSKKYSYKKIKQEIEGRGGALNGYTSEEFTDYYVHFLSKNLEPTLDILLSMVSEPLLDANEIEKERKVILEEIKMYNDMPSSRVEILLNKLLWPNHALGDEISGDSHTVNRIKQADLSAFQKRYYQPQNTVIAFCGNYDKAKIIGLLTKKIKKAALKPGVNTVKPAPLGGLHIKAESKDLEQSYLSLGFRGVSYLSPKRPIINLINVILGANMSSRLFDEIREKRALCYDISTSVAKYKDSGSFVVRLGLDKNKIDTAIIGIIKELKKIKEEPVPLKELSRAKDYFLGQTAMGLEHPVGRMFSFVQSYLTLDKIHIFSEIEKEVLRVTAQDIKSLSNDIFNFENMCISCVGNLEKDQEQRIRKILKKEGYHS